ncbi:MAG: hypothetical protein LBW85_10575 [Deltaproteobacteria bacterium]|jgi:hypothetical protein|nr:hypothetical protein [Deltaproteobacteria bacterium]
MPNIPPQGASRPVPGAVLALLTLLAFSVEAATALAQAQTQAPSYQGGAPAAPAQSGENALASLARAEAAHSVGDNVTAVLSIWTALESVWGMMGEMGIRNAAFVTEEPEYFGVYQPKQGEDFQPGELIILYCEPFGYTMRREADGTYTNSLKWSFQIYDKAGASLGGQDNIGPYTHGGYRTFTTEKMLAFTINLSAFPSGSYTLSVTVIDDFDPQKSVEIRKSFNIAGGGQ